MQASCVIDDLHNEAVGRRFNTTLLLDLAAMFSQLNAVAHAWTPFDQHHG